MIPRIPTVSVPDPENPGKRLRTSDPSPENIAAILELRAYSAISAAEHRAKHVFADCAPPGCPACEGVLKILTHWHPTIRGGYVGVNYAPLPPPRDPAGMLRLASKLARSSIPVSAPTRKDRSVSKKSHALHSPAGPQVADVRSDPSARVCARCGRSDFRGEKGYNWHVANNPSCALYVRPERHRYAALSA